MLTATRTLILFPDSSSSPSSSSSSSNIRHSCIPRPRSQGSGSACLHCRAFQHHSQVEVYFHMITYSNGIGGAKAVTLAPLQNMRTQEPRGTSLPKVRRNCTGPLKQPALSSSSGNRISRREYHQQCQQHHHDSKSSETQPENLVRELTQNLRTSTLTNKSLKA